MSLFGHLFNRKGQQRGTHAPSTKEAYFDMEEEELEEDSEAVEKDINSDADFSSEKETYEVLEREIHPAKIICPDCGGITLEGLEFCDKCGGELL